MCLLIKLPSLNIDDSNKLYLTSSRSLSPVALMWLNIKLQVGMPVDLDNPTSKTHSTVHEDNLQVFLMSNLSQSISFTWCTFEHIGPCTYFYDDTAIQFWKLLFTLIYIWLPFTSWVKPSYILRKVIDTCYVSARKVTYTEEPILRNYPIYFKWPPPFSHSFENGVF